jgi:hypothetical protein
MPLTYSGRNVKPGNGEHPSLIDIAVGLSRQPRFAGQTRRWWSVLDHTLFGDEIVQYSYPTEDIRRRRLAWLLHDAHEAITADVPTDVKRETLLGAAQAKLDADIYDAFFPGGYLAFLEHEPMVKDIDQRALRAEAWVVGPPTAAKHFDRPYDRDRVWLTNELVSGDRLVGWAPMEQDQQDHRAVRAYVQRITNVM